MPQRRDRRAGRRRPSADVTKLPDLQLLRRIAKGGGVLLRAAKTQLSTVGDLRDDERWSCPFPLRYDSQVAALFLGALDSYDIAVGILRERASQQAFNVLRFQLESYAVLRWMTEPTDERERRICAYRVLCGQLRRWGRFHMEDAGRDRDALDIVRRIREWGTQLREIAAVDGVQHLKEPPGRDVLLRKYGAQSGYPTFSMFSELGSHPLASGQLLFGLQQESRSIDYSDEALPERAFWASAAVTYLWQTIELVSNHLGGAEWLEEDARALHAAIVPLISETLRRRQERRSAVSRVP
jgi:hypothetical protein